MTRINPGVDADYADLRHALLVTPPDTGIEAEWRDLWWEQFNTFREKLIELGVNVLTRRPYRSRNSIHAVFSRDTFFAMDQRVLIADMAGHRDLEPGDLQYWCYGQNLRCEKLPGHAEGADLHRHQRMWMAAAGNRTEKNTALMLLSGAPGSGISADRHLVPHMPNSLHLLGSVNPISHRLCVVAESVPDVVMEHLAAVYEQVIERPNSEVLDQVANFVTVRENVVVAPYREEEEATAFYETLADYDVKVHAVDASAYFRAGGGLACATGILERRF